MLIYGVLGRIGWSTWWLVTLLSSVWKDHTLTLLWCSSCISLFLFGVKWVSWWFSAI